MKFRIISAILIVFSFIISSCSGNKELVVAEYGNENITLNEFENAYAKNTGSYEAAKDDSMGQYKDFLDLFVNYKMKLRNAEVRGLATDPEVNKELNDYQKQVGRSYILERALFNPAIEDLYQKRKEEIRVKHIWIKPLNENFDSAKTVADSLLKRIQAGEKFEDLAKQYSADTFSREEGGDIYYITAGMTIPSFEDAIYNTPENEIYPEPVKTPYGYHIIKVTDIQERKPQIRASHILIDFKDETGKLDSAAARKQAEEIKARLESGEDFAALAKQYSDDKGSAEKGGDLGFFGRRQMVKPFDQEAFSLNKGEISDIVKTQFGYHIIKVTDVKDYPPLAEQRQELREIFQKTTYQQEYKNFIDSLKNEFNYSKNESGIDYVLQHSDSAKFNIAYDESKLRDAAKDTVLFSINNNGVILDSLMMNVKSDNQLQNSDINEKTLGDAIDKYSTELLLENKALVLDRQDPEFANLMQDYRNGIYIFNLQENEVWNKIDIDSVALKNFYNKTKEDYRWDERVDLSEIFARNEAAIKEYYSLLQNGADFDSLASAVTERRSFREKAGNWGALEVDESDLSKAAAKLKPGEFSEPFKSDKGWSIVKLNSFKPAGEKTFEEAKPEVASKFQEAESKRLEDEYLQKLKKLYHPKIYYDKLQAAFKNNSSD